MPARNIFVFTAGPDARVHLEDSVIKPVPLEKAVAQASKEQRQLLERVKAYVHDLFAWGATPGPGNDRNYERMAAGDWVLTVYDSTIHFVSQVVAKLESDLVAEAIWGRRESDNKTWQHMYFLTRPRSVNVRVEDQAKYLRERFYGFTLCDSHFDDIVAKFGSVDEYVRKTFNVEPVDIPPMEISPPLPYFLIRSNEDSDYADELGKHYEFSNTVPNHRQLLGGGHVVIDTNARGGGVIRGYGELGPAAEIGQRDGKTFYRSPFKSFSPFLPLRTVAQATQAKIVITERYNPQHSIRPITYEIYEELIGKSATPEPGPIPPYTIDDALREVFLARAELVELLDLFRSRKNVVLQGPPGVGKSFLAKRLAWLLLGEKDEQRIINTQFHQSTSYEDFVRGYRPTGGGGFELRDGLFLNACDQARKDLAHKYVIIIDEINRGNLSKILGELMLLIELDKRDLRWGLTLNYRKEGEPPFWVPPNVYLLGLMNTADRSLALVDYALRRRFCFYSLRPAFDSPLFEKNLLDVGITTELLANLRAKLAELNQKIETDRDLGPGFCIGHSYFSVPAVDGVPDADWYNKIIRFEIAPLLREYWFDKPRQELEDEVSHLNL